jgi:hypothetical protein
VNDTNVAKIRSNISAVLKSHAAAMAGLRVTCAIRIPV